MKKILIIHTGGTFVGRARTLKPGNLRTEINKFLPLINQIARIDIRIPFNLDSSDILPENWTEIYKIISDDMDAYDGFVIIHGTDTMVYTAAALSFLLGTVRKPVILTGAQRPLAELRSDAGNNLINAIELATFDIPEVAICFGNLLFRGTRTKKISIDDYNCFESPNYPPLATIGSKIHVNRSLLLQQASNVKLMPTYEKKIVCVRLFPGLKADLYYPLMTKNVTAIVLEGFGSGNLPMKDEQWIRFIKKAILDNIPVFIASQAYHGIIDLNQYVCGKLSKEAGAVATGDMTVETALVKLMLLFGNFQKREEIISYFSRSLAGELTQA